MAADDALCASGNGLHLPHRNDDRRMLPPAAFVARAENRAVTIPWTMARATLAFGRSPGLRVIASAGAFPDRSSGWPPAREAVLALLAAHSCRDSRGLGSILPHRVPI
ncbi:hypothetical protein Sj15T_37410 [Sphingobium sp. TA15]|nr:hypothetical protein Sj15T_37410 [Sphingobium sp. TA15]